MIRDLIQTWGVLYLERDGLGWWLSYQGMSDGLGIKGIENLLSISTAVNRKADLYRQMSKGRMQVWESFLMSVFIAQ